MKRISVYIAVVLAMHLYLNKEQELLTCFKVAFLLKRLLNKLYAWGVTSELIHNQLKNVQCISGLSQAMPLS